MSAKANLRRGQLTKGQVLWLYVRIFLVGYLLLLLMLSLLENKLIFPAPKYPLGDWRPIGMAVEDVDFSSADGTRLHGWYVEHPQPCAHVLFCHGNGENVAYVGPELKYLRDRFRISIFAFDYRGYGRSEGEPDEPGVMADGDAAQRWLAKRAGIELHDVVLLGRSIGGAIAVDLAARNGARGLILERSFSRLPDVAAELYPFMPVKLLMRSQFDSESKIADYRGPLLQCHGTADDIIPFRLGQRLFQAAPSTDKQFVVEDGYGHNDPLSDEFYTALEQFLNRLPSRNQGDHE